MYDIYIAGSLTNSKNPDEQKKFYEEIAEVCKQSNFSVYLPHQHTDPIQHPDVSPEEVYNKDYEKVVKANCIVAIVDKPSLGVGIELEIAKNNNTGIILVYHKDEKISRIVRGNPGIKHTIQYETKEDALRRLRTILLS